MNSNMNERSAAFPIQQQEREGHIMLFAEQGMTKLELAALLIASGRPKGYTHRLSEWAKEIADEAAAILAAAEQHA